MIRLTIHINNKQKSKIWILHNNHIILDKHKNRSLQM